MPKRGSRRKKTKTHQGDIPEGARPAEHDETDSDIPRSLVVRSNKVAPHIQDLILDLRKVMSPNTANNLREKSYNKTKDYTAIASQLALTHLIMISQTESNIVMKIARFANGPTLHFKVNELCTSKYVRSTQKKPFDSPMLYTSPPLVVLHNFNNVETNHVKLMRTTFQHMFPSISVKTVKLTECRRVVLFHFNKENETVEMRHFAIKATPSGISKSIKKILQSKIPDLGQMEDVSEFVDGSAGGIASDSEAEDEGSKVSLPDRFVGKGNARSQQCSMKLVEIGPRMTLELFKVERGVYEGEVIYHRYEKKTAAEIVQLQAKVEKIKMLKAQRKNIQEENVKRKRELLEETKQKKVAKRQKISEQNENHEEMSDESDGD